MADDRKLHEARELAIARLSDAFVDGQLDVDEFDRRLDDVHRAVELASVETSVSDLTVAATTALARPAVVPVEAAPRAQRVRAVLGSTERKGGWQVARRMEVRAVMGNVELDFREARFPAGVVELDVSAVLGNVEIHVPPSLAVEAEGSGVLGNFEHRGRAPASPEDGAPVLRVRGRAVLGNIEIVTRLPAEAEARRRQLTGRSARALPPKS